MNRQHIGLLGVLFLALTTAGCPAPQSAGLTYYVRPDGHDSASGRTDTTDASTGAWQTVNKCADTGSPLVAGDTCLVSDGTYTDKDGNGVTVYIRGNSGTAAQPITLQSAHYLGAKIVPGSLASGPSYGFYVTRDHFVIRGFDINGGGAANGANGAVGISSSSGDVGLLIERNVIRDIGHVCSQTANGFDGIFLQYGSNITITRNLITRIGRKATGEEGCQNPSGSHGDARNGDHGVYISSGSNITVKNNLFVDNLMGWSITTYPDTVSGLTVVNNSFSGPHPTHAGYIQFSATITNATFKNNLSDLPLGGPFQIYGTKPFTNVVIDHEQTQAASMDSITGTCSKAGVTCTNNVTNAAPGYVNAGADNLALVAGAAAINAGVTLSATVVDDYAGVSRPQDAAYDKGAYEFVGNQPTPPNPAEEVAITVTWAYGVIDSTHGAATTATAMVSTGGGAYTTYCAGVPPATSCTGAALSAAQTHAFKVVASNAAGAAPDSNIVTFTPPEPAVPSAAENVTISSAAQEANV